MRILVTGCNGFIGRNIVGYYLKKGFNVFGIDIPNSISCYDNLNLYYADLENDDLEVLYKTISPDIFIHCAGNASVGISIEHPEIDFHKNIYTLYNTLSALKRAKINPKFVFLSSAAVYGNPSKLPINESDNIRPISPYGLHKKMCEDLCNYFRYKENLDIIIVRIFSAYGAGLKKQIFWDMYNKFTSTGKIELFGTGNETRDFIYIDDIVRAIDIIINNNSDEYVYNIACGKEISIRNVAEIFTEILGANKSIIYFNGITKVGDPINWRADISKLTRLGFKPNIDIYKGTKQYIRWIKEFFNE